MQKNVAFLTFSLFVVLIVVNACSNVKGIEINQKFEPKSELIINEGLNKDKIIEGISFYQKLKYNSEYLLTDEGGLIISQSENVSPVLKKIFNKEGNQGGKDLLKLVIHGKKLDSKNWRKIISVLILRDNVPIASYRNDFNNQNDLTLEIPNVKGKNLEIYYVTRIFDLDNPKNSNIIFYGSKLPDDPEEYEIYEKESKPIRTNFKEISKSINLKEIYEFEIAIKPLDINMIDTYSFLNDYSATEAYFYNNNFFEEVFISQTGGEIGKSISRSRGLITAQHKFMELENLTYNYSSSDFERRSIKWYKSFNFNPDGYPGHLDFVFSNFYDTDYEINGLDTMKPMYQIGFSEIPKTTKLYYNKDSNILTGTGGHWPNKPDYEITRGLSESFVFNIENAPKLNKEIAFYKSPLKLKINVAYPENPEELKQIFYGYFKSNYNYYSPIPLDYVLVLGYIYPSFRFYTQTSLNLPDNTTKVSEGSPLINCNYPTESNPPISYCQKGIYQITWDASDIVKNGQKKITKKVCYTGTYFSTDLELC